MAHSHAIVSLYVIASHRIVSHRISLDRDLCDGRCQGTRYTKSTNTVQPPCCGHCCSLPLPILALARCEHHHYTHLKALLCRSHLVYNAFRLGRECIHRPPTHTTVPPFLPVKRHTIHAPPSHQHQPSRHMSTSCPLSSPHHRTHPILRHARAPLIDRLDSPPI